MNQFRTLETYAYNQRTKHEKGEIKKHIKFDEASKGLYLQIKHTRDEEWIDVSYSIAKADQERNNESRAKCSFLFKPATQSGLQPRPLGTPAATSKAPSTSSSSGSGKRSNSSPSTSYCPTKRPATRNNDTSGSWRPPNNKNSMDFE